MKPASHLEMIESLCTQLLINGYAVETIEPCLVESLDAAFQVCRTENRFLCASVGRGMDKVVNKSIRSDQISWIEDWSGPLLSDFFKLLWELQKELCRNCLLSLKRYEGHFALYQAGSFYEKHLDNHQGSNHRLLSSVIYLNACKGGELLIYGEDDPTQVIETIVPKPGRMVVFDSKRIWHQVSPAHSERRSLTGWFRDDEPFF
jgi:SM-20-related protein